MAHEFKIKNSLQILSTQPVSGISNKVGVFNTYDPSSLVTAGAIRLFVENESSTNAIWKVESDLIKPVNPEFDVQLSTIEIETDAGAVTLVDMPVTSGPTLGDEESYSFDIDGSSVITVYSESDGVGGLSETALVVNAKYQYMGLPNVDNSWRFFIDGSTDLVFEKRVSGIWQSGGKFSV